MPLRDRILFISILLFTASLFITWKIPNFILTSQLIIVAVFYNSLKEKLTFLRQRPWIWWMLGFFLLIILSVAFSSNKHSGFRYLDSRLPLLYFPLSIGLIHIQKELRDKILLGMAYLITVVALACFSYGIYRTITFHETAFLYNDALSEPLTGQQSIYLSLLVNLSIYIFTYYLFSSKRNNSKFLYGLSIFFLFIISFLLGSRNLMVVLYGSVIGFALWFVFTRKKYLEGATLIMGMLIGVFLIYKFFPKTINRFKELAYTKYDYRKTAPESHYNMAVTADQWNGINTRLAIWKCGWELFRENPLFGVRLGDKKDRLMNVYRQKDFHFAVNTQKNLHNNYLDILVSMGIIGLLAFVISWLFVPLSILWKNKDTLSMVILLTFAIAMLTEIYFDRSLGGILFGFFIPFLLCDKKSKS